MRLHPFPLSQASWRRLRPLFPSTAHVFQGSIMPENALYLMDPITDDPEFEGFGFDDAESLRHPGERLAFDFDPDDIQTKGRAWTVTRMASMWTPQPVLGRVQPHN